jgi:hypothetical protein
MRSPVERTSRRTGEGSCCFLALTTAVDSGTTTVVLDSAAPILRRSGYSQDVDPKASQVAAFLARLLVPIDFTPGAEARVASLSPMALYSGFVADLGARYEAARPLRETNPRLSERLTHEAHRLETTHPAEWEAGRQLLLDLEMTKTP